ncbi:MAG: FAD-binding protein [Nitrospiraceae bacterium]|nr:FAD-binding protein [Nitrospiraceae bacterium]
MAIDRRKLRWNGWGWIDAPDVLGDKADGVWRWMGEVVGIAPLPDTPAMGLENITLPPQRLNDAVLESLTALTAPERVKTDDFERALHARGRSYHDLLHLRAGRLETAPDAVVYPTTTEETAALVAFAADANVALIPFGGGSSVVGGVTAQAAQGQAGAVSVDMTLMDRLLDIDEEALVARAEAGVYGPQLEEALQARGYTLGHYPQSFEFSTLGGWIAPRSAGHQSNKYGKAEHWLVSAKVATPQGVWTTEDYPGSAAGPLLREMLAGSEGMLGIITEAEFKIHPVPEAKDYRGYVFTEFPAGVAAAREMMQQGVQTAMIRLSDKPETFFLNAIDTGDAQGTGPAQFCLMLIGIEGDRATVDTALERSQAIVKANGGIHMGESLGRSWYKGRFETPYLRDPMLDHGLGIDTLETATRWSNMLRLHEAGVKAIAEAIDAHSPGERGIVMAHVSHAYADGASLYFLIAFPRDLDNDVEQWWAIKRAASDAIAANGGTISHHHGVGTDHLPWIAGEKGPIGMGLLRAMKAQIDPTGVLNPGKLIE